MTEHQFERLMDALHRIADALEALHPHGPVLAVRNPAQFPLPLQPLHHGDPL